ncbi:MAG: hypothetical protein OEN01_10590 [Candidatus Krumholzibacteria bacterium]|nr:hypothetical protein [Candidatus Krumholzibacteria bacterium]
MKIPYSTAVLAAFALVTFMPTANVCAESSTRRDTQATLKRVDQLLLRTKLICEEMDRQGTTKARCQTLKQMSESVGIMAQQLNSVMKGFQKLAENEALMEDDELKRDVSALSDQAVDIVGHLENALQYMEHMTYRFGRLSANGRPRDVFSTLSANTQVGRVPGDMPVPLKSK